MENKNDQGALGSAALLCKEPLILGALYSQSHVSLVAR
jgi:hypothetical protein